MIKILSILFISLLSFNTIAETDEELTKQLLKDFDDLLNDTYDYKADSDESIY